MKLRGFVCVAAVGLAAGWLAVHSAQASPFQPGSVLAQKKKKKKGKEAPGKINRTVKLAPKGISWGLSNAQVARVYGRYLDQRYADRLKETPLGPQTEALSTELEDRKDLVRRTLIKFGNQPTGVDSTPLKGEYSYRNGESMSKIALDGRLTRYFFYFGNRLWKIYDEHQLRGGGALGASYAAAVESLTQMLGAEPTKLEPDPNRGRNYEEAHWTDGTTLIRLLNRESENIGALVYVDASIQAKLPTMRKNRPRREAIDRSVSEATRASPSAGAKKKGKK